jgi:hypothetical protein
MRLLQIFYTRKICALFMSSEGGMILRGLDAGFCSGFHLSGAGASAGCTARLSVKGRILG